MSAAELLSKMTAHGVQITGEGFGGEVAITAQDVAAALRGTHGLAYDLVLLKYTGDDSVALRLQEGLVEWVVQNEGLSRWDAAPYAKEAIDDCISGSLCRTCSGTGVYKYKDCPGCRGTGRRDKSERARADALGITRHEYRSSGAGRFTRVAALLGVLESGALSRVAKRMQG